MCANALDWLRSFLERDKGVTAIEYGLLAALVAVVIIVAITSVGNELENTFNTWTGAVRNAINSGGS